MHSSRHCLEPKNDPLKHECDEIKTKENILPIKCTEREFKYGFHNLGGFEAIQTFSANYDLNVKKLDTNNKRLHIQDTNNFWYLFRILGISKERGNRKKNS